jgi:hypothetical protein
MEVVMIIAAAWVLVRGMHYGFPLAKRLVEAAAVRIEGVPRAMRAPDSAALEDEVRQLAGEVARLRQQQQFLERLFEERPDASDDARAVGAVSSGALPPPAPR